MMTEDEHISEQINERNMFKLKSKHFLKVKKNIINL